MMKTIFKGMLLLALGFSGQAMADGTWGVCKPVAGTMEYDVPIDYQITDMDANYTGNTFSDAVKWSFPANQGYTCECPNPVTGKVQDTYFKSESTTLGEPVIAGGQYYYKLTDSLAVSTRVQITSSGDGIDTVTGLVPFKNKRIVGMGSKDCASSSGTAASVTKNIASQGWISFKIIKPFVGDNNIPRTLLLGVYASKVSGIYGSEALSEIWIEGKVTITTGCELPGGFNIDVPFGDVPSSAFKGKAGAIPTGVSEQEVNLTLNCKNIAEGVRVKLRIEGTQNNAYKSAIDLGNPDIGVVVKDSNHNVLIPNDTNSTTTVTLGAHDADMERAGTVTLFAAPVSTTGVEPTPGDYNGVATLMVDLE